MGHNVSDFEEKLHEMWVLQKMEPLDISEYVMQNLDSGMSPFVKQIAEDYSAFFKKKWIDLV